VLGIGERLTEAPSESLIAVAFARELQAQQGLTQAMGWVDLAHTITLTECGVIPRDSACALIAALRALDAAPSSFAPTAEYGDLYTNREAWLGERTPAAGWLGAGRARREALTTAYHLVLCEQLLPSACVTEGLIASALNPSACVAARTDVGGAAPEEVTAMADALVAAIGEHRNRVEVAQAHREAALRRLLAEAEKFLKDTS
jgi:argininosuccinate lyase